MALVACQRNSASQVPIKGGLTFQEMVSFLVDQDIAPFKLPERLELVHELPMVAEGQKVDKKLLAKRIADQLAAEKIG